MTSLVFVRVIKKGKDRLNEAVEHLAVWSDVDVLWWKCISSMKSCVRIPVDEMLPDALALAIPIGNKCIKL
jgi:hypothetical protein